MWKERKKVNKYIPVSEPNITEIEKKYIKEAVDSTWISSTGKFINLFENSFADYLKVKHSISVTNGTVALHLALLALGIGEGDEVIVPNFTYIATANAVMYTGATPIFASFNNETLNIDEESIEKLITNKTKAIICVHLYGNSCNIRRMQEISRKYNLYLIEDAAEAIGTEYNGQKIGSYGDISTFSFYGNKTITTGEGGMVVTNSDTLANKIKILKDQGMSRVQRYWFDEIGYNYRMTNIQAAIGYGQMQRINELVGKKVENAKIYDELLKSEDGIKLIRTEENSKNSFWMYSIILDGYNDEKRNVLMEELKGRGVETRPFFYLMTEMPPYKNYRKDNQDYDLKCEISNSGINLPSSTILDKENIEYVCNTLIEVMRSIK